MSTKRKPGFIAQIAAAKREVAKLRKLFPQFFHADGRPIVASARFPVPAANKEGERT